VSKQLGFTRIGAYYVRQIATIARQTFGRDVDPGLLERLAAKAVDELMLGAPRLQDFIPDLALRAVREAVEREIAPAGAGGVALADRWHVA
jgi:hypothetical protein